MTERIQAFVVVLDHDIRDDDAQKTRDALAQIKGVAVVSPDVVDLSDHVARERIRLELSEKLWAVLHPKDGDA